jgi:uncharacterized membrane protein
MNSTALSSWQLWAVLSAVFAALTAIFAKVAGEHFSGLRASRSPPPR